MGIKTLIPIGLACMVFLCTCQTFKKPCNNTEESATTAPESSMPESSVKASPIISYAGQVYLYGESHGEKKIIDREIEIWKDYYSKGMRHLFVELPYFTAQFLNIWMHEESNDIFEAVYADWTGTANHNEYTYDFYMSIKKQCPETIFHGTDVGHQYNSTGTRFLKFLNDNERSDSPEYTLALEALRQGKIYYKYRDPVFRENAMVKNFIRELESVNNADVMGIYGAAHTGLLSLNNSGQVACMANQLHETLGDRIHATNLTDLAKMIEPLRVEKVLLINTMYVASYFGKVDISSISNEYAELEFWRLENSYADFCDKSESGVFIPYKIFPMLVEIGQVFMIEFAKKDGTTEKKYYRSDGDVDHGELIAMEFLLSQ